MAKVFRFHKDDDSIEHWMDSQPYGKTAIDGINDPDGAKASKEITSIPSPFARIDLVKTAFENVVNENNLEGRTIYHKMVSDSLDVAEIFFNIDKYEDQVNIIVWDKNKDLNKLLDSNNPKHKLLGETLQLFLTQDAKAYNFDHTQRLYLLNYIGEGKPNELNIIGGTSPATLFFTSANRLEYVNIQIGNRRVFDSIYQPLYKRDFEFQKFIYGLRKFNPLFISYFKAFNDYLDNSYSKLSDSQKNEISSFSEIDFESKYPKLTAGSDGNLVEVLGINLRKKIENLEEIEKNSGFIINSTKWQGLKPMVLPIDDFTDKIRYTSHFWNRDNKAPFHDEKPIANRKLPFGKVKYPYITISDFLEDFIISTPYPIDGNKFFNGNFSAASGFNKGFLLPIKRSYFDYFSLKDLKANMPDGQKAIEIKKGNTGGVEVTLRIPIKENKYITYSRIYYPSTNDYQMPSADINKNKGAIIENRFSITIYPFLKSSQGIPSYRIGVMNIDNNPIFRDSDYNLSFYNDYKELKINSKSRRSDRKKGAQLDTDYRIVSENFEFIEVAHQWAKGILIPIFKEPSGVAQFTFAVDFGTTNTHIEYTKDNGRATKFEITSNDIQIEPLFLLNAETEKMFRESAIGLIQDQITLEQIPQLLNAFPTRTVISHNDDMDYNLPVHALADTNIPFYYENNLPPINTKIQTNLKWESVEHNEKRIKSFLEKILLLIKNKVLLEKGNLEKTKLIWMYPTSMSDYKVNQLHEIWSELFKKHISKSVIPIKVSESITPFYFFRNEVGVTAGRNSVVSIDIGGGTSDVVIYKDNQPFILTSFKFAGNAIFGDSFGNKNSNMNGFIQKYFEQYSNKLEINGLPSLRSVLSNLEINKKSEEIVSFLLSLEKNPDVISKSAPISFSKDLSYDNDFKIIFTIFYASVLYHIATLMKNKNVVYPRYITFSGTGSKIINLIGNSETLELLTQTIFDDILDNKDNTRIKIEQVSNSKEISCIGALLQTDEDRKIDIRDIQTVFVGDKMINRTNEKELKYSDLNTTVQENVIEEYSEFIDWFFNLNSKFKFKDKLEINPTYFDNYKQYLKEDMHDNLNKGIDAKKLELNGNFDEELKETLFFYPLLGGLNNLAYKIYLDIN